MKGIVAKRYTPSDTHPSARDFFTKRGALDLKRDSSGHRRYVWLYEDMLT